ncbi:MAG: HAMP domain-containing sensor histidine kinase [Polyangiaceae bacterium]
MALVTLRKIASRLGLRIYVVGLAQFALVTAGFLEYGRQIGRSPTAWGDRQSHYVADNVVAKVDDPAAMRVEVERVHETLKWWLRVEDANGRVLTEIAPPDGMPAPEASRYWTIPSAKGEMYTVRVWFASSGFPSNNMAMAVLAIVVIGITSWITARTLVKPLERLSKVAGELGQGNLHARAAMNRADELGEVGRAFDEMAARIEMLLRSEKEMLANVSHELRTPLARIRVALDLASEGDADVARESLGEIAEDLAELERLVDDVLMAARFSLREGTPGAPTTPQVRAERLDVGALLKKSVQKFRSAHPERPVHTELPAQLPSISADPVLLRRVVDNLLDNAHKYTEERERPIDLGAESHDGTVAIWVRDQGMGIAPEDLPRVFEPFFRTDRSRTRATGGLGLGLALARRIVTAHGGTLRLESSLGSGTNARIEVPVLAPSVPPSV